MACKYYFNGREYTEEEIKASILAGDFNKFADKVGVELPSAVPQIGVRAKQQISSNKDFSSKSGNKIVDAKGDPLTLYHGTFTPKGYDPFTKFDLSYSDNFDVGFHFGSREAAKKRIDDLISSEVNPEFEFQRRGRDVSNPRTISVNIDIKNPIRLKELDRMPSWKGYDILRSIFNGVDDGSLQQDVIQSFESDIDDFYDDNLKTIYDEYGNGELSDEPQEYPSSSRVEVQNRWIEAYLKSKGYDGIVYKNTIEDKGNDSYIVFNDDQIKITDPSVKVKEQKSRQQTVTVNNPSSNNRNSAKVSLNLLSLPNVNINANQQDFDFALVNYPDAVRITDPSGNITAIYFGGEILIDPSSAFRENAKMSGLGYVWMELAKYKDEALYKQIIESVKGTDYEAESIIADQNMQNQGFPPLTQEQILQRAAASAISEAAERRSQKSIVSKIREMLNNFLNKLFGMSRKVDVLNMTVEEYGDIVSKSLLGNKPISDITSQEIDNIEDVKNAPISINGALLSDYENAGYLDRLVRRAAPKDDRNAAVKLIANTLVPQRFTNVKSLFQYWFKSGDQGDLKRLMDKRGKKIDADMRRIKDKVYQFRKAAKPVLKSLTKSRQADFLRDASLYMEGKISMNDFRNTWERSLPMGSKNRTNAREFAKILQSLRRDIDGMSATVNGIINDPNSQISATISQNLGVYMTRTYAAFKNGAWNHKMFPKGMATPFTQQSGRSPEMQRIYQAAVNYIKQNAGYPITDREIDAKLKEYAALSDRGTDDFATDTSTGVKVVDDFISKARKDLPAELRAFLGEHTDPLTKYFHTMENMIKYVENKRFLQKLNDIGRDKIFFDRPTGRYSEAIFSDNKYHPLNGIYTTPEIADLIKNSDYSTKLQVLREIAGWWKLGKTALSPMTTIRNFWSNIFIPLANGRALSGLANLPKGMINAWREMVGSPSEFNNILTEYGILNSGISAELRAQVYGSAKKIYDSDVQGLYDNKTVLDIIKNIPSKIKSGSLSLYEFMDNIWRITQFSCELAETRLMFGDKLSNEQIFQLAAERYRQTNICYDMAPQAVKRLSESPLLGTFPTFTSESMRTSVTIPRMAVKDIKEGAKNGNYWQSYFGVRRLMAFSSIVGSLTGLAGVYGAQLLGAVLRGLGFEPPEEELDRVLYYSSPDFAKYDNRIIDPSQTDSEQTSFYNLDFINPWGILSKAYNAFTRTDNYDMEDSSILATAKVLIEPFFTQEAISDIISNLSNNYDPITGKQIYEEDGTADMIFSGIAAYALKNVAPGIITMGTQLYDANSVVPEFDKGVKTQSDILFTNLTGFKKTKINNLNSFSRKLQSEYVPEIQDNLDDIYEAKMQYKNAFEKSKGTGNREYEREQLEKSVMNIHNANKNLMKAQFKVADHASALQSIGVNYSDLVEKIDVKLRNTPGMRASYDINGKKISNLDIYIQDFNDEQLNMLGVSSMEEYRNMLYNELKK